MFQYVSKYSVHAYIYIPFNAHINSIVYVEYRGALYHLWIQLNPYISFISIYYLHPQHYIIIVILHCYHLYAISIPVTTN